MVTAVPAGTVRLGSAACGVLGVEVGASIEVLGSRFTVGETLPARGTIDDYRVFMSLSECQRLLGAEGRINLILAFMCLHRGGLEASDRYQASEMEKALPGFRHITKTDIARGRYMARMTTAKFLYYLLAIVLAITVFVIVITGLQEVSERTREAGILIAMGTGYTYIVGLYMAKMLALALAASVSGFLFGSKLAVWLTSPFLVVQTMRVSVLWGHLPHVVALTCLVALGAEIVPMVKLLRLDPNVILMEE
jgi:ABC-type lipoprotein release transport system permease subunit